MSTYRGIDVSTWQGDIDWQKVKNSGIDFAVIREGFRKTIDNKFLQNVRGAKAAGVVVMVYHFIYTDGAAPAENADSTVKNMKAAGLDPASTMIFADLEYDTWKKNGEACTREQCTQYTQEYLSRLEELGCGRLGIYMNQDYYKNYYTAEIKSKYPIWLADYEGEPAYDCIMQQTGSTGRVSGIAGNVDTDTLFDGSYMSEGGTIMGVTAQDVLDVMRSWIGYNETNKKYLEILNIYNSHKPLARGYAIKPSDEWCDATVSAAAIKAGAVDLIGTEVGVEKHVDIFKSKGIWIEDGTITPQPGDIIVFNWDRNAQPNNGGSDHIGYVEKVSGGVITTIEGNTSESVARRTYRVGHGNIRGFARPRYASGGSSSGGGSVTQPTKSVEEVAREVIQGLWGNGDERKQKLQAAGYNYSEVQAAVNAILGNKPVTPSKSVEEVAREVIAGKWGNGDDRKKKLEAAGYDYREVQSAVNRLLGGSSSSRPTKSVEEIAKEVIRGDWGNGDTRKQKLQAAGYDYTEVQNAVNKLLSGSSASPTKSITEIAKEVIRGDWGNGQTRKDRLEAAGYDYSKVQAEVNRLL